MPLRGSTRNKLLAFGQSIKTIRRFQLDINATLLGEIMIVFILAVGAMSYYLGRRKTQTPILACLLGVMLSIIPPFALLYLVVLVLKNDLGSPSAVVSE